MKINVNVWGGLYLCVILDTELRKLSIFFDTSSMPFLKKLIWEIKGNSWLFIWNFILLLQLQLKFLEKNNNHLVKHRASTNDVFVIN